MRARTFILIVAAVVTLTGCQNGKSLRTSVLFDEVGAVVKARLGVETSPGVEAGLVGLYYPQEEHPDWGAGAYGKVTVDPNAQTPVAEQVAGLTAMVQSWGLPIGQPYAIAEVIASDFDRGGGFGAAMGVGVPAAGIFAVEYTYDVIAAGGDSDGPRQSGSRLFYGIQYAHEF